MLDNRRQIILVFIYTISAIYLARLFYLQIIDDSYQAIGSTNAVKKEVEIPLRGQVYDRYGKLMVANVDVYDLYITPRKIKNLDTLRFCELFQIPRTYFDSVAADAQLYSKNRSSIFLRQLSKEDHARAINAMVDFAGFHFEQSFFRTYPTSTMSNSLGYIGEIGKEAFAKQDDRNPYYRRGDYIGLSGLEKQYETDLRGVRGVRFKLMNVRGEDKGAYKEGVADTAAVIGKNLYTGIDAELQQLADSLMQHKAGSLVAIEPATGEILAMGSYPTYNPNELSGRNFRKMFNELSKSPYKPLINRPLMGFYRPGSTFKLVQSAIGLQMGVLTPNSKFPDGAAPVKCHKHPSLNGNDLHNAIRFSCNPYFYHAYRRIIESNGISSPFKSAEVGYSNWEKYVRRFGFGQKLGIDLPSESTNPFWAGTRYDKVYGKGSWKYSNIYSLSIGEGELSVNILKIANLACIFANRGYFITPHLVKKVGENGKTDPKYTEKHDTGIDPRHFEFIVGGMQDAASQGTFKSGQYTDIVICGKTGTSQNPKPLKDNAIFMCFAPRENPKIAIAVMVEYSGFGGTFSGPVAAMMIEKYLKRKVEKKDQVERVMAMNVMGNFPIRLDKNLPVKAKDSVTIKSATLPLPNTPVPPVPAKTKEVKIAAILNKETKAKK
jgi:penicillin-binding protein 2